ncbi:MrcB family domain-containing protein [Streptomyces rimosus]|uniref:MrcB family domain-containing protein n=1 Tax=Streptomyces rimosus TaxID=1927 RepID=UPI0037A5DF45
MEIRSLLIEVASTYDADHPDKTSIGVHAQDLLRAAGTFLEPLLPGELVAEGYGGSGGPSRTPWIGFFDPAITRDPKVGLYIAYIFAEDLKTVTLTLQQGVTALGDQLGRGRKRLAYLTERARGLYERLPQESVAGWDVRPSFKSAVARALAYEAGSVAARIYEIETMPSEDTLREDLWHLADVLQSAALVEERLNEKRSSGGGHVEFVLKKVVQPQGLERFRPRDASDYISHVPARTLRKTRRHEQLIEAFGSEVQRHGFVPANEGVHPRDLVLWKDGIPWLVEAKTVTLGNPTKAVREAVGQLLEYSYFLHGQADGTQPKLLALFTEEIGVYVEYLEQHGIASIWRTPTGWAGSTSAVAAGLIG